jgi:hypothetical protein
MVAIRITRLVAKRLTTELSASLPHCKVPWPVFMIQSPFIFTCALSFARMTFRSSKPHISRITSISISYEDGRPTGLISYCILEFSSSSTALGPSTVISRISVDPSYSLHHTHRSYSPWSDLHRSTQSASCQRTHHIETGVREYALLQSLLLPVKLHFIQSRIGNTEKEK